MTHSTLEPITNDPHDLAAMRRAYGTQIGDLPSGVRSVVSAPTGAAMTMVIARASTLLPPPGLIVTPRALIPQWRKELAVYGVSSRELHPRHVPAKHPNVVDVMSASGALARNVVDTLRPYEWVFIGEGVPRQVTVTLVSKMPAGTRVLLQQVEGRILPHFSPLHMVDA